MTKLHIANTFFEWELEADPKISLREAFCQSAVFRQLQFLPFLYGKKHEAVLLCDLPSPQYLDRLRMQKMTALPYFSLEEKVFSPGLILESWGPSRLIAEWANQHALNYQIPDWDVVKRVNSKQFSFENSPKLPHALLLKEEMQAKQWLSSFPGPKVLKTCYGVSGKGHLIVEDTAAQHQRIFSFLIKEWEKGRAVIGEPWVTRVLDFSTQWLIDLEKKIHFIGSTICENDARGQYRFNLVGDEHSLFQTHLPFLKEHMQIVESLLHKMAGLGFFGNVGIDAMLYVLPNEEKIHLHPVVEINARKTMGWAALQFQRHYFPSSTVRFSYAPGKNGYLPEFVESKLGKNVGFARNLDIRPLSKLRFCRFSGSFEPSF